MSSNSENSKNPEQNYSWNTLFNDDYTERDDDELLTVTNTLINQWLSETENLRIKTIQELFHQLILSGGSAMLRDSVVATLHNAFGEKFGAKRTLLAAWNEIAKKMAKERTSNNHRKDLDSKAEPLSSAQKTALRTKLWPTISKLAEEPNLMQHIIKQVQSMGVVNENDTIALVYISATSRVLAQPINPLVKGSSSSGKSFTTTKTLSLIGDEYVNYLSTSSALSLVYDERPLSHTILVVFEANQLNADENSTFSMLLRNLISEGKIIHQTTVEDKQSFYGRRVERIERLGPISLVITTTGELHAENETRMLSYHVTESSEQTRSVIQSIAEKASGKSNGQTDLTIFHDFQRWIALGPNDAVIPFAAQIANQIPPSMVRFRRDMGALINFIKACAILYQAQRKIDDQGRVIASVDDYRIAYPIFSKIMSQSSGQTVPDNVRGVVELVASKKNTTNLKSSDGTFSRSGNSTSASEVELSTQQIGTATGIGKSAAYRAIKVAIDLGFLINNETRQGKPYRLVFRHGVDDAPANLLPHPDTIKAVTNNA